MTALQSALIFVSLVLLGGLWKGWRSFQRSAQHHAIGKEIRSMKPRERVSEAELRAILKRRYQ